MDKSETQQQTNEPLGLFHRMLNSHPEKINFVFECSQFGENSFTNVYLNKRQDHFSSLCISNWILFLLGNPNASNIAQFSYMFNVDSFDDASSSWPKI